MISAVLDTNVLASGFAADDLILATAVSAQVDYLVTGDQQLQRLGTYQNVSIVSPRRFLEILASD